MKKDASYNSLFSRLPESKPRAGLEREIMNRIYLVQIRQARIRAALYGVASAASIASAYPLFEIASSKASESGFTSYISLISSDGTDLIGSWSSLALSIIESAPLFEIGAVVATVLAFAYSIRKISGYTNQAQTIRPSLFAH